MICPLCGGEGCLLGSLGTRTHYRCRDCGIDFSEKCEAVSQSFTAHQLIANACSAEEHFSVDELEEYAAAHGPNRTKPT